jgi:nicotinamide-nucleotide amidase
VGLTGVAGPDPVDGHGPGRVYVGISGGGRTDVLALDLPGDRQAIRTGAVTAAIDALLDILGKVVPGPGVTP